jgi:hypothetical protein
MRGVPQTVFPFLPVHAMQTPAANDENGWLPMSASLARSDLPLSRHHWPMQLDGQGTREAWTADLQHRVIGGDALSDEC